MQRGYLADRRNFLKSSVVVGAALAAGESLADEAITTGSIPQGDIDILRFLAAAEVIEADLWEQYNELGGVQDQEEPSGSGNPAFTEKLNVLDEDMSQYVHDNTDDEFSHAGFLNAFLMSVGGQGVGLNKFRTLKGSTAKGVNLRKVGKRLTNLTQLTVDTSFYTRYRAGEHNPDLEPNFVFPQAVPGLNKGKFQAIPIDDADTQKGAVHNQAIANTAGFHFAFIEQAGTSLYPTLALRVSHPVVLRILLSIGPTEAMHFQTWQDKAGNAPVLKDPVTGLVFPNLNAKRDHEHLFQTNLIMPEPCPFLEKKFPPCSVIRPVSTSTSVFGATVAAEGLIASGLFIGQTNEFFATFRDLAHKADAAVRRC